MGCYILIDYEADKVHGPYYCIHDAERKRDKLRNKYSHHADEPHLYIIHHDLNDDDLGKCTVHK